MFWKTGEVAAELQGAALSIGNFDGVHLGHQQILRRLHEVASGQGIPAVAVTFEPHPLELLSPDTSPPRLTPQPIKVHLLRRCGVTGVVALAIDREFLSLDAETFFEQIVVARFQARAMVEGEDFRFGHARQGSVDALTRLGATRGIRVEAVPHITLDGREVSSSVVRDLLRRGEVAEAARLLGRPHRLVGPVVRGHGRGRRLGFPTANLDPVAGMLPAHGVYAGRAWVGSDPWRAAISIGGRPTFDESDLSVEVHLIGYEDDLYGQPMCVELLEYLRKMTTFDSGAALTRQMQDDVDRARHMVPEPCAGACVHPSAITAPRQGEA